MRVRHWLMNLLILDHDGELLALALRARDSGHSILWFSHQDYGLGVPGFAYTDNWASHINEIDVAISARKSEKLDFFKSRGHAVLSPKAVGKFVERTHFDTPHAALCFVKSTPAPYSVRWCSSVYHSPHAADTIGFLDNMPWADEVSLQPRIPGVRVNISRFGTGPQMETVLGASVIVGNSQFKLPEIDSTSLISGIFVIPDEGGEPQLVDLNSSIVSPLWLSTLVGDPMPWLLNAAGIQIRSDVGVCLRFRRSQSLGCLPLYGVTRGTAPHTLPRMSKWGKLPILDTRGRVKESEGWLACGSEVADVIARGRCVGQALKRARSTADKLYSAYVDYCDKGVLASEQELAFLHARGFCLGLNYG